MKTPRLPVSGRRLVVMLVRLEARNFGAATYSFIANTLKLHADNAKKLALASSRSSPPAVAIKTGVGRGNKSTVSLTPAGRELGRALVAAHEAETKAGGVGVAVPPQGDAGQ